MFYPGHSLLSSSARSEAMPSPRAPGALAAQAEAAAQLALSRDLPAMTLSQRLADPAAWRRQQRARRQALEALVSAEPSPAVLERVMDLICMITEESAWSQGQSDAPFDDESHPGIDLQSAETAVLLGWAGRAFGERMHSRVTGKLLYEVRRRLFTPFMAHGDYPFMRGRGERPLTILCDILVSAILLETDGGHLGPLIRQAMRLLDEVVAKRDRRTEKLSDALSETGAISDLCLLMRKVTRGQLDLTDMYPTNAWLDQLLIPWVTGWFFIDPASGDMCPPLSGEEMFRVGLAANDEALTALGAVLHRMSRRPSGSVTGRLLDMSCAAMLAAEAGKPPRLKHAATASNRIMMCRLGGMTVGMHTGGGLGNAGSPVLFSGDRPVLVEIPSASGVPFIGGHGQLRRARSAEADVLGEMDVEPEADFQKQDDGDVMSVELTHVYPVAASVRSCQRTIMTRRREGLIRLVDAFDLTEPSTITFRFISVQKPEYLLGGLRLGPVDLCWEGELSADFAPMGQRFPAQDASGGELYRIELTAPQAVTRAFFTFTFSPAQP